MESMKGKDNVLQVRTLGEFTLTWNGETVGGGSKAGDSQFTRLMQMILHNKERGADRLQMQNLLFDDSNADDVHHLLRSVMYNARRKLKQAGLPETNYIEFKNGRYYWTEDIDVFEDARQFDELCDDAARETDPVAKCDKMLKACYFYTGEFLPQQTRLSWVANESQRYIDRFAECVNSAAACLRETSEFAELENLGRHASKVCPFSDWELITLEALVSMGRLREAQDFYERTSQEYQKEIGISGARESIGRMEQILARTDRPTTLLEDLQKQLGEDDAEGGFFCTYPAFKGIYRMMQRTLIRSGNTAFIMLITVTGIGERAKASDEEKTRISEEMKEIICSTVRRSDIVCRLGKGQFMLLLFSKTGAGCELVKDRIAKSFRSRRLGVKTDFQIRPVETLPGEEQFTQQ